MFELDEDLYARIANLANEGDKRAEQRDWGGLIEKYLEAWQLIPEPKHEWDGCTWILGGIGEAYFQQKEYAQAKRYFAEAMKCYRGEQNSFLLLRLGQLCYDEGDLDCARGYLRKSWDISEGRSFVGQPKKYRDFVLGKKP